MATLPVLRQRIKDNLYSAQQAERPLLGQLSDAIVSTTVQALNVATEGQAAKGSTLEFEVGGEQMYVFNTGGPGSLARSVLRGRNGTTATTHLDDAVFFQDPKWTDKQINDSITSCLKELEDYGLYIYKNGVITLVAGQDFYEIADTDVIAPRGVVSVFYQGDSPGLTMHALPFQYIDDLGELTGPGLHLLDWGDNASGDQVHYIYKARIDNVTDTDVDTNLEEIVVLGATAYMLAKAEGPRLHDPGRHTDRTVQPGANVRSATWFLAAYQRAITRRRAQQDLQSKNFPRQRRVQRANRWVWG